MPELPEVETTCRAIAPHIVNQTVTAVVVRDRRLRWPVQEDLADQLQGKRLCAVARRAKYLLFDFANGTLIGHLGMSGSLSLVSAATPAGKHAHFDIVFNSTVVLRLTDPRRFGAMVWTENDPLAHRLLSRLGPEPLSSEFGGQLLYQRARRRVQAVKSFIMDNHTVVGVGNIYATEALFRARIKPDRACGNISLHRFNRLATALKSVLEEAIQAGGTTLKDFVGGDGKPGYFAVELAVYGRAGLPCVVCRSPIAKMVLAGRSTSYCPHCQSR